MYSISKQIGIYIHHTSNAAPPIEYKCKLLSLYFLWFINNRRKAMVVLILKNICDLSLCCAVVSCLLSDLVRFQYQLASTNLFAQSQVACCMFATRRMLTPVFSQVDGWTDTQFYANQVYIHFMESVRLPSRCRKRFE